MGRNLLLGVCAMITDIKIADDIMPKRTPRLRVTSEERRLIDEAVAAGKITIIAPGVRAINEGDMSWSARKFNFKRERGEL